MKKLLLYATLLSPLTIAYSDNVYFIGKGIQPLLFSHGLGATHSQYKYFAGELNVIDPSKHLIATFDFPSYQKTDLGQKKDIFALKKAIKALETKIKSQRFKTKVIGIGFSRGASTLINYFGTLPEKEFGALILFAPFSSIKSVFQNKIDQIFMTPFLSKLPSTIADKWGLATKIIRDSFAKKYSPEGEHPIDTIETIHPSIPILFIHSAQDKLCPIWGTYALCNKLVKQKKRKNNVYFLKLEKGGHVGFLKMNNMTIKKVVHAFYKRYGFPYDENLANNVDLNNYQYGKR